MKYLSALLALVAFNAYSSYKFSTYNIRMFDSKKSLESSAFTNLYELKNIITKVNTDFLAVQEIVDTRGFYHFIKSNFPKYNVVFSKCGGMGRQKIGFVFNQEKFTLLRAYDDDRISSLASSGSVDGCSRLRPAFIGIFVENNTNEKFIAIGVHLKAGAGSRNYRQRARQYRELTRMVSELKRSHTENIILLGDFNSTGYLKRDRDFYNFDQLLSNSEMETISEKLECTSYWSGRNRNDDIEEISVLDHIIHPRSFLGLKVKKTSMYAHCLKVDCDETSRDELGVSYKTVSDHCPITLTLE